MTGSLGEKIGEGATSDVHAWAPGQVVKLFKPQVPRRIARWEARMTRAVFETGGPALEVLDEVQVEGRHGLVLPHLEGPTLLQQLQAGAITITAAGETLAELGLSLHRTVSSPELMAPREYLERSMTVPDAQLPLRVAEGVLALMVDLPVDEAPSHSDLHPGNVIMTPDGPRLIDWIATKRGGGPLELACCHFNSTELIAEPLGSPEEQRALDAALQSAYARQAGLSLEALQVAIEARLPIVRAFFLLGGRPRPATRARLLQRLETDLGYR